MRIPFFSSSRNRLAREETRDLALTELLLSNARLTDEVRVLSRQVGELVKLNQRRENLVIAAMDVVDGFDNASIASDAAPHFTELELAPLLRLFQAAGRWEAAEIWERLNDITDGAPFAEQNKTVDA